MTAPADDTDVGGIVAHLRIRGSAEWQADLQRAQQQAEALGRVSPTIRISTNAAELRAQLDEVTARLQALARLNPDVRIRTNNAAVQADLAAIRARLEALGNENTTLRLDLTAAQRQIEELRQRTGRQGGVAGRDFGAQFTRGLRETLAAIPKIELDADATDVDRELQEVRAQLEALSNQRIGVDISAEDAQRALAALMGELQALQARAGSVDVRFNTAAAAARIARLQAQLNGITVTPDINQGQFATRLARAIREASAALPKIDIDADSTPAQRQLADIRARMVALGEQKIGVDISAADAAAKLKGLQSELDRLSRRSRDDLRIKVDTAAASAKLAALQAQVAGLGATSAVGGRSGAKVPLIIGAVIAGVSTAGPLLAAATAGTVALAGAVGVAALAYKGLADAEERSTSTGLKLRGEVKGLGSELNHLGVIAADRAAPGVLGAMSKIRAYMPELRGPIAGLARHLGQALNVGAGGTVTALRVMQPLLDDAGEGAETLARKWDQFAASPRFAQFIDYARRQLPIVAGQVGDLSGSVVQLAQDLAPLGEGVLKTVVAFGKGTNAADDYGDAINNAVRGNISDLDRLGDAINRNVRGTFGVDEAPQADPAVAQQAAQFDGLISEYERRWAIYGQRMATETQAQLSTLQRLADQYGATVPNLQAVIDGEGKAADQLAMTTLAMQRQNDASGLLKMALDDLSGKEMTAAQAENRYEQSILAAARAMESQKEAAKGQSAAVQQAATSVTGFSEAAVNNRGSLLNQIEAAKAHAGAHADVGRSTDLAKTKLIQLRKEIIDNAVSHGANREAVEKYMAKLLPLSKLKLEPTEAQFDARAARIKANEFQKFLGRFPKSIRAAIELGGVSSAEYQLQLLARSRTARINVVTTGGASYQQSVGGRQVFADGGTVQGIGGPREDKELIWASPGEEIIKNGPAQRHRALLKAINAGKFADGGTVGSNIYTLTPNPSETTAAAKEAAKRKAAAKVKIKVEVDTISATAGDGSVYGIASYIRGQLPSVAAASRLLSMAVNDAFTLKGIQAKITGIRAHLAKVREDQQSLKSGVAGKLSEGADPGQFQSIEQYTAYLDAKADQNARYNTQIAKLRGNKALPADLLARFAAEGPSPILDSLAAGSRSSVAGLVKASSRFDASVAAGSGQAAAIYGPAIAKDNANLTKYAAQAARTETAMVGLVLQLAQLVNRPVTVKVDGKTWATTKYVDKELQGVLNELRHTLVTRRG